MTSEPFAAQSATGTADSERGLLFAVLLMVVLGVGGIFLILG